MKDNLIDEEKAKKEEAAQESLEQKLERIGIFSLLRTIYITWYLIIKTIFVLY